MTQSLSGFAARVVCLSLAAAILIFASTFLLTVLLS